MKSFSLIPGSQGLSKKGHKMRKYNPALKNMVDNYRSIATRQSIRTEPYTDEEIFKVIEYWSGMSTNEETTDAVMDDLRNGVKR